MVQFEFVEGAIGLIFAIALGVLGYIGNGIHKSLKRQSVQDQAIKDGLISLLHAQMLEYYTRYVQNKRKLTLEMHQTIESVHEAYKALGGNHGEDRLYAALSQINPYIVQSTREEQ